MQCGLVLTPSNRGHGRQPRDKALVLQLYTAAYSYAFTLHFDIVTKLLIQLPY